LESPAMDQKNERVELEMKIKKYRAMVRRTTDEKAARRLTELIAELERKQRDKLTKVNSNA
jgi:hypothetical protein